MILPHLKDFLRRPIVASVNASSPTYKCKSPEMTYFCISKEMSSLYFGLDVFFVSEAIVPEFDGLYTSTAAPSPNS
jgi:hypothetical protein